MQSVDLVIGTLNTWERVYTQFINVESTTQAIGWSWLMSGFGDKRVSHEKLLPIQTENQEIVVAEGYNKPTEETLKVLSRILELNRVPQRVMLALVSTKILTSL